MAKHAEWLLQNLYLHVPQVEVPHSLEEELGADLILLLVDAVVSVELQSRQDEVWPPSLQDKREGPQMDFLLRRIKL